MKTILTIHIANNIDQLDNQIENMVHSIVVNLNITYVWIKKKNKIFYEQTFSGNVQSRWLDRWNQRNEEN